MRLCVCPVHRGKTSDLIRMLFGLVGWMGPRMKQVLGFGDWSVERGNFGGEYGATRCNQWGLCGIAVQKCVVYPAGTGLPRFPGKKAVKHLCVYCV